MDEHAPAARVKPHGPGPWANCGIGCDLHNRGFPSCVDIGTTGILRPSVSFADRCLFSGPVFRVAEGLIERLGVVPGGGPHSWRTPQVARGGRATRLAAHGPDWPGWVARTQQVARAPRIRALRSPIRSLFYTGLGPFSARACLSWPNLQHNRAPGADEEVLTSGLSLARRLFFSG